MKIHRLATALAASTYVLLLVGGLVHGTDSGLACPDWPLCYGSVMPRMTGHVAYEHTHRLVATTVGLLSIALGIAVFRSRRDDSRLRTLAWLAVGLVIVQGVLGGMTVLFGLPDAISTAHLGVSMLFFALTIYLAFRTRPGGITSLGVDPLVGVGARIAAVLVYAQLVLGALVRHIDGVAMACHLDVVLCRGALWPDWHWTAQLHMAHRWNAVLVLVVVLGTAVRGFVRPAPRNVRALLLAAPILVVVQMGLGVLSIRSLLEFRTVTAHLGVAALIFADLVCLWILTRRAADSVTHGSLPVQATAREAHA